MSEGRSGSPPLLKAALLLTLGIACAGCTAQELGVVAGALGTYNAAVMQPLAQQNQNFQNQWQQNLFLQQQQMHEAMAPNVIQP
jgi:hypothetical protein